MSKEIIRTYRKPGACFKAAAQYRRHGATVIRHFRTVVKDKRRKDCGKLVDALYVCY